MQRSPLPLTALTSLKGLAIVGLAGLGLAVDDCAAAQAPPQNDLSIVGAATVPVPGTVAIPAGRAWIGSSEKEIEELLAKHPGFVRVLDAQTPQQQIEVPAFAIGQYEVTNTEYAAFVEATGRRPPIGWADAKAEEEAARAFAKAEQEKFEAAREAGKTYERRRWAADVSPNPRDEWWEANWRTVGYKIKEGEERYPVVLVTYEDAEAYCTWAGVRLQTEFEFQRAARKESKSMFPWGDTWEDGKYSNTAELRRAKPHAVGSFPAGASPFGVHDLAGNVWEWTSSPYAAYKGFKQGKYTVKIGGKREELSVLPTFDPNQRVVVGGAFEVDSLAARVPTRRATERTQATGAMGFRVAASQKTGLDAARHVLAAYVQNAGARPDAEYDPEAVVAVDRYRVGAAGITGYDHLLFIPIAKVNEGSENELRMKSREAIAHLGVLSSNVDILEPELPAGVYFVAFRAKGKPPRAEVKAEENKDKGDGTSKSQDDKKKKGKQDEPAAPVDPALEGLDLDEDWLLFLRRDGTRAAAVKAEGITISRGQPGGSFKVRHATERIGSGASAAIEARTYFDLECNIAHKISKQALPLRLALRPAATAYGQPWRQ